MTEQVEGTDKTPQYQTIGYGLKVSDGKYGNRNYYGEMQANGASFNDVVDAIERDIEQRESMHKQVETLSKKIDSCDHRLYDLRTDISSARRLFEELKALVLKENDDDKTAEEVGQKQQDIQTMFESITRKFDGLGRILKITWETEDKEDNYPF